MIHKRGEARGSLWGSLWFFYDYFIFIFNYINYIYFIIMVHYALIWLWNLVTSSLDRNPINLRCACGTCAETVKKRASLYVNMVKRSEILVILRG